MAEEIGNSATDTRTVSLPIVLLDRIDAVWRTRGYVSRADYVRAAIQRQLAQDEGRTEGRT